MLVNLNITLSQKKKLRPFVLVAVIEFVVN